MKSSSVSLGNQLQTRTVFYLVSGLLSGMVLWGIEAVDRHFALHSQFVQAGEAALFPLYFVFTAVGGPLWGLFLALCAGIRLGGIQLGRSFFGTAPKKLGRYEIPAGVSHRLLAIAGIFIFFGLLAVVIPTYFSDPLYGMLAGATEKIRLLRTLFGYRKISTVLILGALAVAVALLD
ncbi:MAG: hypothetical protein K1Y36_28675, partial [Blastocatellia bacterium]|nr:hypothetical protein [Blastocatellia bacterium]